MYQRFVISMQPAAYWSPNKILSTPVFRRKSTMRKKIAAKVTITITIAVEIMVSLRDGHVTLAASSRTCWMKVNGLVLAISEPFPHAEALCRRQSLEAQCHGPALRGTAARCTSG